MYLSKLTLDSRHPRVRRDLSDPYEMHRTLTRAFCADSLQPPDRFLWRLERSADLRPQSIVLVQSVRPGDWSVMDSMPGYAVEIKDNKAVTLERLVRPGGRYRFRLLANPTITRAGKRYGLVREEEQIDWLNRQSKRLGFAVEGCVRLAAERLSTRQGKTGNRITLDTALFEGILYTQQPDLTCQAVLHGVGHGKALGLGLLSLARIG